MRALSSLDTAIPQAILITTQEAHGPATDSESTTTTSSATLTATSSNASSSPVASDALDIIIHRDDTLRRLDIRLEAIPCDDDLSTDNINIWTMI